MEAACGRGDAVATGFRAAAGRHATGAHHGCVHVGFPRLAITHAEWDRVALGFGEPILEWIRILNGLAQSGELVMTDSREFRASDEGFSLTELLMAMAIFAVVMAIVGGAMLGGFTTIRDVLTGVDREATVQNAAEWTGRMVRYMDVPDGGTTSIEEVTPTSMSFYTYSGQGARADVPMRVRLWTQTNADGSKTLKSLIVEPTRTDSGWTFPTLATQNGKVRDLLTVDSGAPVTFALQVCNSLTTCSDSIRSVTLPLSGMPTLAAGEVPYKVTVTLGDPAEPANQVVQTIRTVNLP